MGRLIGILGGTFDPIHYGHLRPAYEVMQAAMLDEVRFIPNKQPPHRDAPLLDGELRCECIEMAIAHVPRFILDRREIERDGASYMVDTLASLAADFPGDQLCLIMGMDAFGGLQSWHRWQQILELCQLVVTTRPGTRLQDLSLDDDLQARIIHDPAALKQGKNGRILLQSVTQLDISASQIRQSLKRGEGTYFLLPDTIREKLEKTYAI